MNVQACVAGLPPSADRNVSVAVTVIPRLARLASLSDLAAGELGGIVTVTGEVEATCTLPCPKVPLAGSQWPAIATRPLPQRGPPERRAPTLAARNVARQLSVPACSDGHLQPDRPCARVDREAPDRGEAAVRRRRQRRDEGEHP